MQNTLLPCVRGLISLPLYAFNNAMHLIVKDGKAKSKHETSWIH